MLASRSEPLTERERLELCLLDAFPQLKPLEPEDHRRIEPYKDGSFAVSLMSFFLYANGHNLRGISRNHPNGLLYHDSEALFAIGLFRKTLDSPRWHIMICAPRGPRAIDAIDHFVRRIRDLGDLRLGAIYVRHLSQPQYDQLRQRGYRDVAEDPWIPEAPAEDETYNHKRIPLSRVIDITASGELQIKTLVGPENKGFRTKARLSYNRFANFLARNRATLDIGDYTHEHQAVAEELVRRHFGVLKNPVGSTPEDYVSLLRYHPAPDHEAYFGTIGFLRRDQRSIPIMLFIGERTGPDVVALYATFASRAHEDLGPDLDITGFSAISQYCYLRLFERLWHRGVRWVDVGGSETRDLDRFKQQLGALHEPSFWVVT